MSFNLPEGIKDRHFDGKSYGTDTRTCPYMDDDAPDVWVDTEQISNTIFRDTWECPLCGDTHVEDRDTTEYGI